MLRSVGLFVAVSLVSAGALVMACADSPPSTSTPAAAGPSEAGEGGGPSGKPDGGPSGSSGSSGSSGQADAGGPKVVFVTSDQFKPDDFFGVEGADAKCYAAAELRLAGTFKTWMAKDQNDPPNSRFTKSPKGYVRTDGVVVADSWDDLVDGNLKAPIDHDEFGELVTTSTFVWSGALADGFAFAPSGESTANCFGWSVSATGTGRAGDITKTNAQWADVGAKDCSSTLRVYCFEQ